MKGKEYLIAVPGPKPRKLQLCDTTTNNPCKNITLETSKGAPIPEDADGAEVIALPNGKLLMVHNMATTANGTGDVYLAHPKTNPPQTPSDLLTWVTSPVPALTLPAVKEDDPALSPDGLVILFFWKSSSSQGTNLWVPRRPSLNATFPPPVLLTTANSKANDSEPSLAKDPNKPGYFELFFMSDRNGNAQVYHTTCGP